MNDNTTTISGLLQRLRAALEEKDQTTRRKQDPADVDGRVSALYAELKRHFDENGWQRGQGIVERELPLHYCALALTQLARMYRVSHPAIALALGRRAFTVDPRPYRAKWLGFLEFDNGNVSEAARLLDSLPADTRFQPSETSKQMQIDGNKRLLSKTPSIPRQSVAAYKPRRRTVLYVSSACQPFHVNGYTIRSQALLKAAEGTAWKAHCITRPGYPWDRRDSLVETQELNTHCDGVEYQLIRGASAAMMPPDAYIVNAAVLIESAARKVKPAVIQAASNHMTALPALIAARRLGVPFVYEVRGLWELSAASSRSGWEQSERFRLSSDLEARAASHADVVFTLTRQLSAELQQRGVAASRIHLLPNGGDAALIEAAAPDRRLLGKLGLDESVFTIGYAGAIKYYEGLDDLLEAMALLRGAGRRIQAVIVGDGDWLAHLRTRCDNLGLAGDVRFPGKLPPPEARAYVRAADLAVVPRKRLDVGETVSPLKPFEVMALGVPLLMSNVAPLLDITENSGHAAALFEASDPAAFAKEIGRLMDDAGVRQDLANRALDFVTNRGSWGAVARTMISVLDDAVREFEAQKRTLSWRARGPLRLITRAVRKLRQSPVPAHEIALLGSSELFDTNWYLRRYPDVARSGMNPIEHYLRYGATERRDPGPDFTTAAYIKKHPEVIRNGINPLVHHLHYRRVDKVTPQ